MRDLSDPADRSELDEVLDELAGIDLTRDEGVEAGEDATPIPLAPFAVERLRAALAAERSDGVRPAGPRLTARTERRASSLRGWMVAAAVVLAVTIPLAFVFKDKWSGRNADQELDYAMALAIVPDAEGYPDVEKRNGAAFFVFRKILAAIKECRRHRDRTGSDASVVASKCLTLIARAVTDPLGVRSEPTTPPALESGLATLRESEDDLELVVALGQVLGAVRRGIVTLRRESTEPGVLSAQIPVMLKRIDAAATKK